MSILFLSPLISILETEGYLRHCDLLDAQPADLPRLGLRLSRAHISSFSLLAQANAVINASARDSRNRLLRPHPVPSVTLHSMPSRYILLR
ncbi:hypothetical protein P692DRAFT_20883203 [Suillus brevipes Sb2]|nr:hypothetical protein P692DRAFT_20883203 [Suillus brevipes Sb2]